MNTDYFQLINQATVYDVAKVTPLDVATNLSERFNNQIYLKREDLQPVFSFKIRGAYNKISQLTEAQKQRGIIAASAGNHAQGVAYSAQKLGISATIVMPETTPQIKVTAVEKLQARVVLSGISYSDAAKHAAELVKASNATYIHPYDDPLVIAGQGTIGKEIIEQLSSVSPPDYAFLCIGGGGLAAGVASYIRHVSPKTRLIGVQASDSDAMKQSIAAGNIITLDDVGIFADGVAVKRVGEETFHLCNMLLDDIITVSTDDICAAIKDVFEDTRSVLEPAGALSVAGAKRYIQQHDLNQQCIVTIASGANVNFDRLRHVAERTEFAERREGILAVTIPEQPGSFKAFCQALGKQNITEFNYRYSSKNEANVYVGVQIKNADELNDIIQRLQKQGYAALDLTDDEMAKLHIRHLVGGHASPEIQEALYRFRFPERPGALMDFLNRMGSDWNITLFHYRNHGSDFGRVLCGLQIPAKDETRFAQFIEELGYPAHNESDNPAYRLFLS